RCLCHALPDGRRKLRKDPEQVRFYRSAQWKALRATVLAEEPVCRICSNEPATVVDHIDGNWRNNSRGNLRGLGVRCERRRTARQHAAKARNKYLSAGSEKPLSPNDSGGEGEKFSGPAGD